MGRLRRIFGLAGRTDRRGWWSAVAAGLLVWGAFEALFASEAATRALPLLGGAIFEAKLALLHPAETSGTGFAILWGTIAAVFSLAGWALFAASVRRLHDRDLAGPRIVLFFVPVAVAGHWTETHPEAWWAIAAGLLWLAVDLGLMPGVAGPNRFGEAPAARDRAPGPIGR